MKHVRFYTLLFLNILISHLLQLKVIKLKLVKGSLLTGLNTGFITNSEVIHKCVHGEAIIGSSMRSEALLF